MRHELPFTEPAAQVETTLRPELHFDFLVICGPSGVGKTTIANQLAERLTLPKPWKMGEHLRKLAARRNKKEVLGPVERRDEDDIRADELLGYAMQRHILYGDGPRIIEARRAALVARIEEERARQEGRELRVVKLFLTASPEERYGRIHRRQPGHTLEEVAQETAARESYDLAKWRRISQTVHGKGMLYEVDPFDPDATSYDIIVNTDGKSVKQVLKEVIMKLGKQQAITYPQGKSTDSSQIQ